MNIKFDSYDSFRKQFLNRSPLERAGYFIWPSLGATECSGAEEELLQKIKPLGITLFGRNLKNFQQSKSLVENLNLLMKRDDVVNSLICIDEEGGRVSRLPKPHKRGHPASFFSNEGNVELLREEVLAKVDFAKKIGINCFFSPCLDVLLNPKNSVIGDRSFGSSPKDVIHYSDIVAKIYREYQILYAVKHFPGHGNTLEDSHMNAAVNHASLESIRDLEWRPFKHHIQTGTPLIMTAHVCIPVLDGRTPATLSSTILSLLRNDLQFEGIIISDDMRMNAISEYYGVTKKQESDIREYHDKETLSLDDSYLKEASIDAFLAGCDVLLSCKSLVSEKGLFFHLSEKLAGDHDFSEIMTQKAWRIFKTLDAFWQKTENSMSNSMTV